MLHVQPHAGYFYRCCGLRKLHKGGGTPVHFTYSRNETNKYTGESSGLKVNRAHTFRCPLNRSRRHYLSGDGSEVILDVINRWSSNENVIVIPNLGAKNYHAAIDNCLFVIGNSSSGVIEVPYFDKFTVNVGQRQSGRNAPKSVINTESDIELLKSTICDIIDGKLSVPEQEYIYGRGQSIAEIIRVLKSIKF